MEIKNIIEFFSPFSEDFQDAIEDFYNFCEKPTLKKTVAVSLAILGGLSTFFILGIGAFPVFRWAVRWLIDQEVTSNEKVFRKSDRKKIANSSIDPIIKKNKLIWEGRFTPTNRQDLKKLQTTLERLCPNPRFDQVFAGIMSRELPYLINEMDGVFPDWNKRFDKDKVLFVYIQDSENDEVKILKEQGVAVYRLTLKQFKTLPNRVPVDFLEILDPIAK